MKKSSSSPKQAVSSRRDFNTISQTDKNKYHPKKEREQLAKILISHNSNLFLLKFNNRNESEKMFDEFEYEDKYLKEAEGYFTEEVLSDKLYNNL
ncbi:9466_t:CDS:2 [Cetraspora pellucida]|uniref:9466_t:CDS:1 n=1 Tax=Cetraspora pellucida TaxID=1433469 RepID=A0A9N9FXH3_9GLOM|nr:9466_t:CDS:2 [Cetraspora pellucida]